MNTSDNLKIYDPDVTVLNPYHGGEYAYAIAGGLLKQLFAGAYQQTTSGLSLTDQNCYELDKGCYSVYGFEYVPGYVRYTDHRQISLYYSFDKGYITWISDNKPVWTVMAGGLAGDPLTEIGPRPIPQEPMVILLELWNWRDADDLRSTSLPISGFRSTLEASISTISSFRQRC